MSKTKRQHTPREVSAPAGPSGRVWRTPGGYPVSCAEKIKMLNENLSEIRQLTQDALEDAVLMGCDESQFRQVIRELIDTLENPYADK